MAKFTIDIIFCNANIKLTEIFDYNFLKSNNNITYEDVNEFQVSSSTLVGYCNIYLKDFSEYFLYDEMYSEQTLIKLEELRINSVAFTFLFSRNYGLSFIDKTLNFIDNKYRTEELYVINDQNDSIFTFNSFYKEHCLKNFFWLPHH